MQDTFFRGDLKDGLFVKYWGLVINCGSEKYIVGGVTRDFSR